MERLRRPGPLVAPGGCATTALSFVNCTKYPPSLQFLLMTLGPSLLALAAFDRGAGVFGRPLVTLGRVPLFYYLLQWYVIHGLALAGAFAHGEPTDWLFIDTFPIQPPPSSAFGLAAVYGWWIVVLALLVRPLRVVRGLQKAASGIVLAGRRRRRGTRFSLIALSQPS